MASNGKKKIDLWEVYQRKPNHIYIKLTTPNKETAENMATRYGMKVRMKSKNSRQK